MTNPKPAKTPTAPTGVWVERRGTAFIVRDFQFLRLACQLADFEAERDR